MLPHQSLPHAPLQRLTSRAVGLAIAVSLAYLCWQRGGVNPEVYSVVFGTVLTLAGLLFLCAPRLGLSIGLPWPLAVVALLPVLQLTPLGPLQALLWHSWRQDLDQTFARFGVQGSSAVSLYPLATLRAAVVLAGCCALFVMARALARHRRETVVAAVTFLVALTAGEAVLGLGQSFWETLPGATTSPAAAHGTFVNRNHFAVLLEAGCCLAIGLAVFLRGRDDSYCSGTHLDRCAGAASQLAAGLCLAGIAASGSRMGILVACAAVLAAAFVFSRRARPRLRILPAALLTLLLAAAPGFPETAQGFVRLFRDGGDPGRVAIWTDALASAGRHFPAGSGLGTFAFAFRRSEAYFPRHTVDHAHCDWLEFLVELGLPGTLLLAVSIGLILVLGCRRAKDGQPDPLGPLRAACVLAAGAILLHSSVDFPLQIPALAALLSVLLGCAAGLTSRGRSCGAARPLARRLAALGCWSFALAGAGVHVGKPGLWDAQSLFERGRRELFAGHPTKAGLSFRKALQANPYWAPAWQKRAEVSRLNGEEENEIEMLGLASALEPFALRTEWPAAQSLLRRQRWEQASQRLYKLAETLPDLRPAVFRAAFQAGMPAARITASVVPAVAAGAWLRMLADVEAWDDFDRTLAQWARSGAVAASRPDLRYTFDRLFQRRQQRLMKSLWQAAGGSGSSSPFQWRSHFSLAPGSAANQSSPIHLLAPEFNCGGDPGGAKTDPHPADGFESGFGFQWASQPTPGVLLRSRDTSPVGPHFELEFRAPPPRESVHLSHYVALPPGSEQVLEAAVLADLAGGELRLELWSAQRLSGCSLPIRRSGSWRKITFPFRTETGEEVLQLRVISRAAAGKVIRGRFSLGAVQVRPARDPAYRNPP
jgi:O-antigen ligase